MTLRVVRLPDGRLWLRVADPAWEGPLNPTHAARVGGRWNPPDSFPTLYLNADVYTAQLQLELLLEDAPLRAEDLRGDAYVLVAATLPRDQRVADAVTDDGLHALGLPASYPADENGERVPRENCQPVGAEVQSQGLRGVCCRSAVRLDASGRELAWFPADRRSRAQEWWDEPRPLSGWREAESWDDLGECPQPDPEPLDIDASPDSP